MPLLLAADNGLQRLRLSRWVLDVAMREGQTEALCRGAGDLIYASVEGECVEGWD